MSDNRIGMIESLCCPPCPQPSDEPCPSSCGVGHMMSHPKLLAAVGEYPQERQHVTDAAWERSAWDSGRPDADEWHAKGGLMLVTVKEWDERGRDAQTSEWNENSSLEKWFPFTAQELATLRAQLAEKE